MAAIKYIFLLSLSLAFFCSRAQFKPGFRNVDNFKMKDAKVKVYFKDPLAQIAGTFDDFEKKPDEEKNRLLEVYLMNHELYVFKVIKDTAIKCYVIRGDPKKVKTSFRYQLDIYNGDILEQAVDVQKTINEIDVSGEFFADMTTFQQPRFKKLATLQIWGNIVHIKPYEPIKQTVLKLIELDQ